jgi:hypothetical protein
MQLLRKDSELLSLASKLEALKAQADHSQSCVAEVGNFEPHLLLYRYLDVDEGQISGRY